MRSFTTQSCTSSSTSKPFPAAGRDLHLHQHFQRGFPSVPFSGSIPPKLLLHGEPQAPISFPGGCSTARGSSSPISSPSVSLRKQRGWASDLSCSLGAIIVESVNISFKCLHAFKKFTGLNGNKYSQGAVSCHSFAHQIPAIFKSGSVHGQAPKSFEKQ